MKKLIALFVCLVSVVALAGYQATIVTDIPDYTGGTISTNLAGTITTNTATAANVTNLLTLANASTTNTLPSKVLCPVQSTTGTIFVSLVGTNASFTSTVGFNTEKSFDGKVWFPCVNFVMTGSGLTAVNTSVDVPLTNAYYIRISNVTNANSTAAFGRVMVISK